MNLSEAYNGSYSIMIEFKTLLDKKINWLQEQTIKNPKNEPILIEYIAKDLLCVLLLIATHHNNNGILATYTFDRNGVEFGTEEDEAILKRFFPEEEKWKKLSEEIMEIETWQAGLASIAIGSCMIPITSEEIITEDNNYYREEVQLMGNKEYIIPIFEDIILRNKDLIWKRYQEIEEERSKTLE